MAKTLGESLVQLTADLSNIHGSRDPLQVVQASMQLLQCEILLAIVAKLDDIEDQLGAIEENTAESKGPP